MTGGEAIVDALLRQGVYTGFGIPGVQTYGLYDALACAGDSIRVYGARHERPAGTWPSATRARPAGPGS
jgi:acetolactate synthase-1/2/3 large subunit